MRYARALAILACLILCAVASAAQQKPYRTLNDTFAAPRVHTRAEWERRAAHLREADPGIGRPAADAGAASLNAQVFGEIERPDYIVSKVYFESLPGFFVTGNLYRPVGAGPFPAILSPHGHWAYGRLENSAVASVPGRAINLARQGFVVLTIDMVGYNDSRQLEHRCLAVSARSSVGSERCGAAVVERHPVAGFPGNAPVRRSRRDWRDRCVGRRDPGVSACRGRPSRRRGRAR